MAKAGRESMELTMTQEPSVDTDDRADEAWLLSIQRKLYQWSDRRGRMPLPRFAHVPGEPDA
jgi:hypothetical protein